MKTVRRVRALATAVAVVMGASLTTACAPLVIGGVMVGSVMIATDRRTTATQLEDQTIEFKASSRIKEVFGDRAHVNVNSFNRLVLLTGEVPAEADRARVEQLVGQVDNVKSVVNEVAALPVSSLGSRSNDSLITSKVKATFVDAKDLDANAVKVQTERGSVYLMGRVTEREANTATELARSVGGVQRVVKVFETITEAERAAITAPPQK